MSKPMPKGYTEALPKRTPKGSLEEITKAVEQIDTTIKQLCAQVIPPQPYLLSVPSDLPYRHSSRFISTWYVGTPFAAHEDELQYSTFLPHQGDDESLLRVVGGWADEKGNLIEEESSPPPTSLSGRNTPSEQANRKKISLKDYKSKDKTRPGTPTQSSFVQNITNKVMKSEDQNAVAKKEVDRKPVKPGNRLVMKNEKGEGVKIEASPSDTKSHLSSVSVPQRQDLPSPRKKRRLSSESPKREASPVHVEKKREAEESKDLPLLLSPTLPTQKRNQIHKSLPVLLLPDLPPTLEKAVADADVKVKPEPNTVPRTEQVRSILGNALGSISSKHLPEHQSGDSVTTRERSDSQSSARLPDKANKAQSPSVKPVLKPVARPSTPLENGMNGNAAPRKLMIVLRYGKKNRKRVESLLKFASRSKKTKPVLDGTTPKPAEVKSNTTPIAVESKKLERKRPADSTSELPAKRPKPLEAPEKPVVNGISAAKSPSGVTVNAKQKGPSVKPNAEVTTPKKEPRSSAMKRIESQEGGDVRTPQGDRGRVSTPISGMSSSQAKVSPGPSTSVSREERIAWQDMDTKFFALGRTLKHEGTGLGPPPNSNRSEKDSALSVVLLIEALLCFMLNHTAQSHARPNVDPGWSTILPYHIFVFRASRKYRHLHGLVIQLGAVCRQSLHSHEIERLAREPLPFEHFESAPTPGSDGTTRTNDDFEKYKKRYVTFRDQLVHNSRELQSAWLEGSRYLSPTLIEREYPKTWAKRTKDTSKRGVEKIKPDAIGREYYIPLDINSSAFEATRFSLSFLREWSDKEKIDWKPRVEL